MHIISNAGCYAILCDLHEELAKVGVTDADLAPGETYHDLGNVRADELVSRWLCINTI